MYYNSKQESSDEQDDAAAHMLTPTVLNLGKHSVRSAVTDQREQISRESCEYMADIYARACMDMKVQRIQLTHSNDLYLFSVMAAERITHITLDDARLQPYMAGLMMQRRDYADPLSGQASLPVTPVKKGSTG